ncbi:MAG: hypothetical protein A3D92_15405 [Bacteroidetes bacterium RIFCSPHIGHO2_02_FULL_44_7]|nr:MAG: hypothetical protein A3D92_15405 [Bacteroidetes bacterium RIFCSPHIGHO2_02_FULL_44_7]
MRTLVLLFFALALTSCVSRRELVRQISANPLSTSGINGTYSNSSNSSSHELKTLLFISKKGTFNDSGLAEFQNANTVKIVYDGFKDLWIQFRQDTELLYDFHLKVKNRGDYLQLRRKLLLIPIPFVYFHKEKLTILANDGSGNLLISGGLYELYVLFGIAGGIDDHYQGSYARIPE